MSVWTRIRSWFRSDAADVPRDDGLSLPPATIPSGPGSAGWVNPRTGQGYWPRDKAERAEFVHHPISPVEAEEIWQGSDIAARIVELPVDEMLRTGWHVRIVPHEADTQSARDLGETVDDAIEALGATEMIRTAMHYGRAYGGGAILLGADDGLDPKLPLNEKDIKSFRHLTLLHRRELVAATWYTDVRAPKYGEVATWYLQPYVAGYSFGFAGNTQGSSPDPSLPPVLQQVHESRLILFRGAVTSRQAIARNQGWGGSIFDRLKRPLRNFEQAYAAIGPLLGDFAQGVIKVSGLDAMLGAAKNEVYQRYLHLDTLRSITRSMVLDKDREDFQRMATPMAGFAEALDRAAQRLAAGVPMPVTLLLGEAPAGLQATGDANIRHWYDDLEAQRPRRVIPALRRVAQLVMLAKDGPTRGVLPKKWSIWMPSLWQMSETEKADVRLKTTQADDFEIKNGTITPDEAAVTRYGGDEYNPGPIVLDMEARAARDLEQPDEPTVPEPMAPGPTAPPAAAPNGKAAA